MPVCADNNHVRTWTVTRFRGMISTQPGSTPLTSFKILSLDEVDGHGCSAGTEIGSVSFLFREKLTDCEVRSLHRNGTTTVWLDTKFKMVVIVICLSFAVILLLSSRGLPWTHLMTIGYVRGCLVDLREVLCGFRSIWRTRWPTGVHPESRPRHW